MALDTYIDVINAVKSEIKRGDRYDSDIQRKLFQAVRFLERNQNYEWMKTRAVASLFTGAEAYTENVPDAVAGILIAPTAATAGTPGIWFNEWPTAIKTVIRFGLVDAGQIDLWYQSHDNRVVRTKAGNDGSDPFFYEITQVPLEEIQDVKQLGSSVPETYYGVKAKIEMPTRFALTRLFNRPDYGRTTVRSPNRYYRGEHRFIVFNGILPFDPDWRLPVMEYYRYTNTANEIGEGDDDTQSETQFAPDEVYTAAFDFLVASVMNRMMPTLRKPVSQQWQQQEETALRTLNIEQKEKEYAETPPMELGYYPL